MKKKKKNIIFILLLTLFISACGSASGKSDQPAAEPAAQGETVEEAAPTSETGEETAPAAEAVDPVKEAAMAYFTNLPEDKHMIFVPELFKKMDAGEEMLIIDTRSAEDYAEGHLK